MQVRAPLPADGELDAVPARVGQEGVERYAVGRVGVVDGWPHPPAAAVGDVGLAGRGGRRGADEAVVVGGDGCGEEGAQVFVVGFGDGRFEGERVQEGEEECLEIEGVDAGGLRPELAREKGEFVT